MALFQMPVRTYMTRHVYSVDPETPADEVWRQLWERRISAVPVVDGGTLVGVVSRTDLIRGGKVNYPDGRTRPTLELPARRAGDLMLGIVIKHSAEDTIQRAARSMTDHHMHRVYVDRGGALAGVLSARDVMQAVADERVDAPVSTIMTHEVKTLPLDARLAAAADMLSTGAMTGVVIADRGWPAGVITQEEILLSRDHPPDTAVERVMTEALVALPPHTPIHRAAAFAIAMHVRRIVVIGRSAMAGIVTSLDLVRVAASS